MPSSAADGPEPTTVATATPGATDRLVADQTTDVIVLDEPPASDAAPDSPGEVGVRIAEARRRAGLGRDELGDHLGVRSATVRRWENGGSSPRPNHLDRLADVLGVSPSWLVDGRGESPADDELDEVRRELASLRGALTDALDSLDRMSQRLGPASR